MALSLFLCITPAGRARFATLWSVVLLWRMAAATTIPVDPWRTLLAHKQGDPWQHLLDEGLAHRQPAHEQHRGHKHKRGHPHHASTLAATSPDDFANRTVHHVSTLAAASPASDEANHTVSHAPKDPWYKLLSRTVKAAAVLLQSSAGEPSASSSSSTSSVPAAARAPSADNTFCLTDIEGCGLIADALPVALKPAARLSLGSSEGPRGLEKRVPLPLLATARFVVILREPIARALTHFNRMRRRAYGARDGRASPALASLERPTNCFLKAQKDANVSDGGVSFHAVSRQSHTRCYPPGGCNAPCTTLRRLRIVRAATGGCVRALHRLGPARLPRSLRRRAPSVDEPLQPQPAHARAVR